LNQILIRFSLRAFEITEIELEAIAVHQQRWDFGLTEPKKIAQDPMVDIQPLPDSRSWGTIPSSVETIKDSSLVNAVFGAKDLEHRDNNRRALSIFTRQYLTPDS
jgi:hypothetical protein